MEATPQFPADSLQMCPIFNPLTLDTPHPRHSWCLYRHHHHHHHHHHHCCFPRGSQPYDWQPQLCMIENAVITITNLRAICRTPAIFGGILYGFRQDVPKTSKANHLILGSSYIRFIFSISVTHQIYTYIDMYIYIYICELHHVTPTIYLSIYLSTYLSFHPSIHPSIYPSIYVSIYLCLTLSPYATP